VSVPETDLAPLIRALSDSRPEARERAAAQIFARGRALAQASVELWLADPRLAECFVLGPSGQPEETVGVAVEPVNFEGIRAAFGSPALADVPPDQDALEFELALATAAAAGGMLLDVRLDILTTRDRAGSGAIARYLQKFGQGIQQVELLVKDVDAATEILRAPFGVAPVYPATRAGANATRVNFFLVATPPAGKLLIELVEAKSAKGAEGTA